MADKSPKTIQDTLERRTEGTTNRELAFDPRTGEIVVVQPNERPSPDAVTATAIADEGFFMGR